MNSTARHLQDFGLTDKQATAYLALYRLGEATAYQVAKESGLKRPTVYLTIDELRKKGLVLVTPHKKKHIYTAKNPHEFIYEFQGRVARSSQQVLALLPALSVPSNNTKVFSGSGALSQGLAYGMYSAGNQEVLAFYSGIYPRTKIKPEYNEHFEEMGRLGYKLRSIVPSNSLDQSFRARDLEFGFESKKIDVALFSSSISVEIFNSHVKFIVHKAQEVIVIENQDTVRFFRQIFEIAWRQCQ